MKHSEFWLRMEQQFGHGYARVWADNHVMRELDGRTAMQALDEGESPKTVWRAVHANLQLPASER
ncbi:hypothetical protein ASE12_04650 [Aeromicrobium sp. Root236]|uniref:DUF3046 domain-containing protein n=1 Tax=Aeromicrobium sp. Root236 TaxID=1736498 RepID=UPI0006FEA3C7|nr:DUF3046 domain-containing protein [Aeromicrobium sp. Root236]KRC64115.1 hypothetical protein ASE12_04650 [Aeromicrobium sp. Root236]